MNLLSQVKQGGHCPGNQGNQGKVSESKKGLKVREKSGNLRKKRKVREFEKKEESQGI